MSRSQQSDIYKTATTNSGTSQAAATEAKKAEDTSINAYEAQLAKLSAQNPYNEQGEFQTDTNKVISSAADLGSDALTNQLQTQAQRTGENAGASIATAAENARKAQREMSGEEAGAEKERLGLKAGYDTTVTGMGQVPAQLRAGEYQTALGGSNQALGIGEQAAQTPSFWDTLGSSFASQLGKTAGGGNLSLTKAV